MASTDSLRGVPGDRSFASAVVHSALATNIFLVPFVKRSQICFVAGRILCFLAAFTHHLVVWLAAEKVYPGRKFTDYAVLGDDVLITDPRVAPVYADQLDQLGVSIFVSKSLISNTGCVEFAKRFWVDRGAVDFSPISLRCLQNDYHPNGLIAIHMKYGEKRVSTRIGGHGFRTLARLAHTSSNAVKRKRAMWDRTILPLELWLGRGKP